MKYFLRKKRWMAWVVLLTFMFTTLLPTNFLLGNNVAEAAGYGGDTGRKIVNGKDAVITPTLNNVQCAYVYFKDASGAAKNPFVPVTGTSTIPNFVAGGPNGYNGQIVFFVKPDQDYLLTGLGANGAGDIYDLQRTKAEGNFGQIAGYPGLEKVVARAKAQGYVACFGYSRQKENPQPVSAIFTVNGVKPSITVAATSDKTKDVVPGNILNIGVTIRPQTVVNGKTLTVDAVKATGITINGKKCAVPEVTSNGDGTYSGTIAYRTTLADCESGAIEILVDAAVDYSYVLGVKDSAGTQGSAKTKVTIRNSAETSCSIAGKSGVVYDYTYANNDGVDEATYPEAIVTAPMDDTQYYKDQSIILQEKPESRVEDTQNQGYWTFDGWYKDGKKTETVTMPGDDQRVVLTGIWTFHSNEVVVTVRGLKETKTYNGQEQRIEDTIPYEIVNISSPLYQSAYDKKATMIWYDDTMNAKGTNIGTYSMGLTAECFRGTTKQFPKVIFVVEEDGALTITPKEAAIEVADASKVVGTQDPVFTGTVTGLVKDGDLGDISYDRTNKAEKVGWYEDVLTAKYTKNANYNVTVVPADFTITQKEAATYTVRYWYQNAQTGAYELESSSDPRTAMAGQMVSVTQEDVRSKDRLHQLNSSGKSVLRKQVAADDCTVLDVYFDSVYKVVYCNADGTTVADTGYQYRYDSAITAPAIVSTEAFDGKWYTDKTQMDGSTEWIFGEENTIKNNIAKVDLATNSLSLYTAKNIAPQGDSNTLTIRKTTVNAKDANAKYGFQVKFIVHAAETQPESLTPDKVDALQRLNSSKIMAEHEWIAAQTAFAEANAALENSGIATTRSALSFILFGDETEDLDGHLILPAWYSISTGSSYEFREYNLVEDSFDVRENDGNVETADKSIMERISDFIQGMVHWRTPMPTLDAEQLLIGLNEEGIHTSGSAIAFSFEKANDLYQAAKDLVGKEQIKEDAEAALNEYMAEIGRYAAVTIRRNDESVRYIFDKDASYEKDKDGNYVLTYNFDLESGKNTIFAVEATPGTIVDYIVTEVTDGGAVRTMVNDQEGKQAEGTIGEASEVAFVNIFAAEEPITPEETPEPPPTPVPNPEPEVVPGSGSSDSYDGPYSDDTTNAPNTEETVTLPDEEVPLAEAEDVLGEMVLDDLDVPLADLPEAEDLEDAAEEMELTEEEVPLGDAPQTGDSSHTIPFVALLLFSGLGWMAARRLKDEA